jgi:zinc transport system substrate-binding protein
MNARTTGIPYAVLALVMAVLVGTGGSPALAGENEVNVLCTTFPIHQITRNVVKDREGVSVGLMLPSQLGCPHDYTLTPQEVKKLAQADVLVVNGLGLEEFLGAPVEKVNADLAIIDSSAGIEEFLEYTDEDHRCSHHCTHDHGHDHHHHHQAANPHLFASPRMAAKLAMTIQAGLSKADPEGAAVYVKNAKAYSDKLSKLADEMAALGKKLENNRIIPSHGIFDYLARDMGLEVIAVMQPHGQEPSAAEMVKLVETIREKKAGAIFTEPQYPEKAGRTLARETGVRVGMLDPVASGPEDAPLDYYETVMRKNMQTLEDVLGVG